jgi:hypothetical protein
VPVGAAWTTNGRAVANKFSKFSVANMLGADPAMTDEAPHCPDLLKAAAVCKHLVQCTPTICLAGEVHDSALP